MVLLGINIDHVATLRQARRERFPDPIDAAREAIAAGATGITAHLREDRRHIQDDDIRCLKSELNVPLNMEMSISPDIVRVALRTRPEWVCLVPENRRELTTEGGLDVEKNAKKIGRVIYKLKSRGIKVSLFVDADIATVRLAKKLSADAVELHTGTYARLFRMKKSFTKELARLRSAAETAVELDLLANAGHGIDYDNVKPLLAAHRFNELNIGFSIMARAMFVGVRKAVSEMKAKMR